MNVNNNSNNIMQGSFNFNNKNKKVDEEQNKTVLNNGGNSYDKMIGNLQEQIKKVQESDDDAETKKTKISDLQKQIENTKKLKQEQEAQNLAKESKKLTEEKPYAQSKDGDKLMLSEDMQNMLKSDIKLDKLEEKDALKTEMKGESEILASEIETDKGRGVDTAKKEEQLADLQEKLSSQDENILDEIKANQDEKLKDSANKNTPDNAEEANKDDIKTMGINA